MKINPSPGFGNYQSYVQALKNAESQTGKPNGGGQIKGADANTDKVTLSGNAAARAEAGRVAAPVAAEVDASASPARIAELTEKVQSGEYFVSSGQLADAILGKLV